MTAKTLEKSASVVTSSDTKQKMKSDLNLPSSFRIQEIAEDPEKTVDENLVPTTEKVKNAWESLTKRESNQVLFLLRSGMRSYLWHRAWKTAQI